MDTSAETHTTNLGSAYACTPYSGITRILWASVPKNKYGPDIKMTLSDFKNDCLFVYLLLPQSNRRSNLGKRLKYVIKISQLHAGGELRKRFNKDGRGPLARAKPSTVSAPPALLVISNYNCIHM